MGAGRNRLKEEAADYFPPPEERDRDAAAVMTTRRGKPLAMSFRDWLGNARQDAFLKIRQNVLDRLAGLEAAVKRGVSMGLELLPSGDPLKFARSARNSFAVTHFMVNDGQVRLNRAEGTVEQIPGAKGLVQILEPLRAAGGRTLDDFKMWLVARRAERLIAEGRERNVSPEFIAKYKDLDRLYGTSAHGNLFRQVDNELQQRNSRLLDFAEASGILTEDVRAKFEHGDYVPFFRAIGEDPDKILGPHQGSARSGTSDAAPPR